MHHSGMTYTIHKGALKYLFLKNMKKVHSYLSFLATIGVRTVMDLRKWSWVEMEKVASLEGATTFFAKVFKNEAHSRNNHQFKAFFEQIHPFQ
jgi:hypothetical protein